MAGWNTTDIDYTSAATLKPTLERRPYLVLYDIAEALRERARAAAITLPNEIVRGDRRGRVIDLDASLDTIITNYVDHSDNAGDFDGYSSIPMWTVAAFETYVTAQTGLSRPATPVRGGLLSSAWAFYMYKAIPYLRWTKQAPSETSSRSKSAIKQSTISDWETAIDAASWSNGQDVYVNAVLDFKKASDGYFGGRWARTFGITEPSADYNCDYDFYALFTRVPNADVGTYDNPDYPNPDELEIDNVDSGSVTAGNAFSHEVGYFSSTNMTLDPAGYGEATVGYNVGGAKYFPIYGPGWVVLKWYVSGGFDYV